MTNFDGTFYHDKPNGIQYINGAVVLAKGDISVTTDVEVGTLISDSSGSLYVFNNTGKWAAVSTSTIG